MSAVRRIPDHRSEPCEQQPENGLALVFFQRKRRASSWKTAQAVRPLAGPDENPQEEFSGERPGPGRVIIGRLVLGNSQDNTVRGGHGVGMFSRMKAALSYRT